MKLLPSPGKFSRWLGLWFERVDDDDDDDDNEEEEDEEDDDDALIAFHFGATILTFD